MWIFVMQPGGVRVVPLARAHGGHGSRHTVRHLDQGRNFFQTIQSEQGCQIYLGQKIPKAGKNVPNELKIYQMVINIPNVSKIFQNGHKIYQRFPI
jgi:hypothetical protein